jgi:hypothetical protein
VPWFLIYANTLAYLQQICNKEACENMAKQALFDILQEKA